MSRRSWALRKVPEELADRYRREGWWTDDTLGSFLDEHLRRHGDRRFRVWSDGRPFDGTVADVAAMARRFAGALRARGVGPGDVVAFQLPNWVEAAAVFWGTALVGAVIEPIVHIYGPRELRFILGDSSARVLVTADRFRHLDYLAALAPLRAELPGLELVAVVGDQGDPAAVGGMPFADLLAGAAPLDEPVAVDCDEPTLVAYTSGTTSDPKGVIHTHRNLVAEIRQMLWSGSADARPPVTGAPVGHVGGMIAGLLLPIVRGYDTHLLDWWDPALVVRVMREADAVFQGGATFFLTSLLDSPEFTPDLLDRVRRAGLGGAPIPAAVVERAKDLGISLSRMYGSSEHMSTTGTTHDDPWEKRVHTDGRAMPGVELRIVDDEGNEVPPGQQGEILSRGPDLFMGYTNPGLTADHIDPDGWYATGDIGVVDPDGYLTITDRKKDIIIRGGENISAAEVEELLGFMPGVAEVAVVAAPDPRTGEHGCAFFRMHPGHEAPDLAAVRAHLEGVGLARQKWPEEVRAATDFPRTATGKIQKFVLRQGLREEAAAGAEGTA